MAIIRFSVLVLLAAPAFALGSATAAEPEADLPAHVRALFVARCAACHGPDLRRPKGKFGYVTDLERLAANRRLIVPSNPAESRLWQLVESDDMPPEDAPGGSLTSAEKRLIHDWIAAGAPSGTSAQDETIAPPPAPVEAAPPSLLMRLLGWLGRWHILVIHFPIALLTAAAAAEAWCLWRGTREPWLPVRFCVVLGTAAAVGATALGWLHADIGGHGHSWPELLAPHRWIGTAAAAWSIGIVLLSEWDAYRGKRSWAFRVALWIGAALVGAAAHFGGSLVHGVDFFAW
jgi:mono/diheme cytochrome c family protein